MLILGKQYTKSNPNKIGGVIMLFELFKKELNKNNVEYETIDLNWRNYGHWIFAYPVILLQVLTKVPKHKYVSFHGTANEFIYLAPVAVFYSKLLRKKISLRKFAGNFDEVYKNGSFIQQSFIRYILKKSDILFFETKYLVAFFKQFNSKTYWFPNVREETTLRTSSQYSEKFVFIGQVRKEKGIDEIIEAFKKLDTKYNVDIYGPLSREYTKKDLTLETVTYKGLLTPNDITATLQNYDVLLLPSYREGYPGVIIEAFSVGLPVIATNLKGISEIVTKNSGLLIDVQNGTQIKEAVESISNDNYGNYSDGAIEQFQYFDSTPVTKKILDIFFEEDETIKGKF